MERDLVEHRTREASSGSQCIKYSANSMFNPEHFFFKPHDCSVGFKLVTSEVYASEKMNRIFIRVCKKLELSAVSVQL